MLRNDTLSKISKEREGVVFVIDMSGIVEETFSSKRDVEVPRSDSTFVFFFRVEGSFRENRKKKGGKRIEKR